MVRTSAEQGQQPVLQPRPSMPGGHPKPRPALERVVRAVAPFTGMLADAMREFWSVPVEVALLSISQRPHYFWKLDDYHVSQLTLDGPAAEHPAQEPACLLRLSDSVCAALLARTLGERDSQKAFSFKQLSPLETTILNEFSRDLLAGFKKNLVRKPSPRTRPGEPVHLVWAVRVPDRAGEPDVEGRRRGRPAAVSESPVGKIVLSLPINAVRTDGDAHTEASETVPDEFFFHARGEARVHVGGTRLALADLAHLEPGDLVVLEDSHAERMALVDPDRLDSGRSEPDPGARFTFPVTLRQKQRMTMPMMLPPLQEPGAMDTQQQARQSLWDNLMIDVTAEFEPVRLPLKQIRQMTEGLVVEMGDIVHNRICLQVDGKTLAWGELLVVGDRFAVRISQVVPESGGSGQDMPGDDAGQPVAALAPDASAAPLTENDNAPDEEENLDNFLNDDFDEFDEFGDDDEYDEEET